MHLKNIVILKAINYIPVIGVDAIQEARELINQGFMIGTVIQNSLAAAEAVYAVGMNLVFSVNSIFLIIL